MNQPPAFTKPFELKTCTSTHFPVDFVDISAQIITTRKWAYIQQKQPILRLNKDTTLVRKLVMKKSEMRTLIDSELARIPQGDEAQQQLRFQYQARRQHCLKENPSQLASGPFREAVEGVRKSSPEFSPKFRDLGKDAEYFGWDEGHNGKEK